MAINPIQKKTRNAFLGGVALMLIIGLIIGGVIYYLYNSNKNKEEEVRGEEVIAYVLNQDVKSGQIITSDLLVPLSVYTKMIPSNYISIVSLSNFEMQDKNGNILNTDEDGNTYISSSTGTSKTIIQQDADGYYKETNGNKEYIEFVKVPCIAKTDMKANSILTLDNITKSDEVTTNDLRLVEYNMITLPTTLAVGDYIDIRVSLGNGQDFIVISKKQVMAILGNTISLYVTEGDILMMNSAIVESYIIQSSNIYAIQYVEAGIQTAAIKTYTPTQEVQNLISGNSNIVSKAKESLQARFLQGVRDYFSQERAYYIEDEEDDIIEGVQEQIQAAKKAREAYLTGVESY